MLILSSHAFGTTPKNRCDQPTSVHSWIRRQFLYFSKPGIVTRSTNASEGRFVTLTVIMTLQSVESFQGNSRQALLRKIESQCGPIGRTSPIFTKKVLFHLASFLCYNRDKEVGRMSSGA